MPFQRVLRRGTFQTYLLVLCGLYFMMVLLFHSDLQDTRPAHHAVSPPRKTFPPYTSTSKAYRNTDDNFIRGNWIEKHPSENSRKLESHVRLKPKEDIFLCVGLNNGIDHEFQEVVPETLSVYSAYLDSRPNDFDNKNNVTYIRIMSIFKWYGQRPEVQCTFQLLDGTKFNTKIAYYEMCENHGRPQGGFILSCLVPPEIPGHPCSVTVAEKKPGSTGKTLKVLPTKPEEDRDDFAICVSPIFGDVDPKKLIEFIELSTMLGVNRINFYDFQMSEDVAIVLQHYLEEGRVSVIPWDLPKNLDTNSWYHGQLIAIQDCLYRNMRKVVYLAFNDMDEFIVPHKHSDLAQLMSAMFNPRTQCAFQFHSAFFDVPKADARTNTSLFTMQATRRTAGLSNVRTKCMVKPYLIFEKGIHHVSKPIWANLEVTRMPEGVAFLHHYRRCIPDFAMDCHRYTTDTYLDRYAAKLEKRVTEIIQSNF